MFINTLVSILKIAKERSKTFARDACVYSMRFYHTGSSNYSIFETRISSLFRESVRWTDSERDKSLGKGSARKVKLRSKVKN